MYKIVFRFIALLACLSSIIGCCPKENDEPGNRQPSQRTILVYMLADNNLGYDYKYDELNITDMGEAIASMQHKGRLLIFYAGYDTIPYLMEIKKSKKERYTIEKIKYYDNSASTDSSTMHRVLSDVREIAPAEDYGLIMWSHATNWLPNNRFYIQPKQQSPTSFGREGNDQLTMNIDEMSDILNQFHHSFILFDACLMGSIEVAYELRNACDYIIASPTETLGTGYPYRQIVPLLFDNEIDYTRVCEEYNKMYITANNSAGTISLIKTNDIENLANICQSLVAKNTNDINYQSLQYYDRKIPHLFCDLHDYMSQMCDSTQLQYLQNSINDIVLYKAASKKFLSITIKRYCGLSCYIPGSSNDTVTENYYKKLEWYQKVYN